MLEIPVRDLEAKGKNGYIAVASAELHFLTLAATESYRPVKARLEIYSKRKTNQPPLVIEGGIDDMRAFFAECMVAMLKGQSGV